MDAIKIDIKNGVLRAEQQNIERLLFHKPVHKINLGPHIPGQPPPYCLYCGKPQSEWASISEECIPEQVVCSLSVSPD